MLELISSKMDASSSNSKGIVYDMYNPISICWVFLYNLKCIGNAGNGNLQGKSVESNCIGN